MSSAVRNFVVIFLLFLLIFGICGHFITTTIVPGLIEGDDSTDTLKNSITNESNDSANESFEGIGISSDYADSDINMDEYTYNFAFFCLGIDEDLVGIYLVHVNNYYQTTVSTFMPGTATTEIGGSTLAQIYKFKGKDYLIEKLYYLTDLVIDDHNTLYSFDKEGGGKSITELSSSLEYKYRVNTAFEYPNPLYTPEFTDPEHSAEESNVSLEESQNDSEESSEAIVDINEYFTIPAGSYSLNGLTEGFHNYKLLLDSKYNPNVSGIFNDLLSRLLSDGRVVGSTEWQTRVMKYFIDASYGSYDSSSDVAQIFNNYKKSDFVTNGGGINDWDETKEYFKTLEKVS